MRSLSLRLAVILAAVTLVGLVVVDVVFSFWLQKQAQRERRLATRAAVAEIYARCERGCSLGDELQRAQKRYAVELSLTSAVGDSPTDFVIDGAYEVLRVPLPPQASTQQLVAAHRRDAGLNRALATQIWAMGVLAAAGGIIIVLGVWSLRRAVQRPLGRMTELVASDDSLELERFGVAANDELAALSRAITTMRQRIASDKQQIAAQLEALASTQAQLVRAERLAVVGQLAAGLAHEVGNPLAVVSGFIELLEDPGLSEAERKAALVRMGQELERMQATVRSLLDFSRAPQAVGTSGELREVLAHVRALLRPQERLRGVSISWPDLHKPVPVALGADGLTQLLLNLLLNAADALAGKGQIQITIEQGDKILLDIEDSGPGIPAELRQRVFEPFFSTKPAGRGTGLGLAVCEHLVASAGGDIAVGESNLGGAAFRITLPARASREQ